MTAEIPAVRDLDLAGALRNDRAGQPVADAGVRSPPVGRHAGRRRSRARSCRSRTRRWNCPSSASWSRRGSSAGVRRPRPTAGAHATTSVRAGVPDPGRTGAPRRLREQRWVAHLWRATTTDGRPSSGDELDVSPADDGWRAAASAAEAPDDRASPTAACPSAYRWHSSCPVAWRRPPRPPTGVRRRRSAVCCPRTTAVSSVDASRSGDDSNASSESTTTGHPSPGGKEQDSMTTPRISVGCWPTSPIAYRASRTPSRSRRTACSSPRRGTFRGTVPISCRRSRPVWSASPSARRAASTVARCCRPSSRWTTGSCS